MSRDYLEDRIEFAPPGYGFIMSLRLSELVDLTIHNTGSWEEPSSQLVQRLVKPGNYCIDIGANIGWFTCLLAQVVGSTGKVLAFEPMLDPYAVAMWNCGRNAFRHVKLLNRAISDRNGTERFAFKYSCPFPNTIENHIDHRFNCVEVSQLDDFLGEMPDCIDFVKIDVDGLESAIVRGGQKTLARTHYLLIELGDYTLRIYEDAKGLEEDGACALRLVDQLKSLGFTHFYHDSGPTLVADWDAFLAKYNNLKDQTVNVLATRKELE